MQKLRLNIDGKEIYATAGQTILDVAKENDIFIPTLCFDERTEIYGSCGLCVCEVEGNPRLVKACATTIMPNMVILTNTPRVRESRKTNLELLLSNHKGDCKAPCMLACPAGTDCQGYVGLIANGQFEEAIKLIKENIPLPGSIGRVCPHPCEEKCRRKLVDGDENAISIRWLKRFAADLDMESDDPFMPDMMADTGKKVAIIGGGPLGLSAAYFLRLRGHAVTIYEAMPKAGGMLRYGIPEYRLPKEVLDEEIALIEKMGVKILTNTKVEKDIPFETIRASYDAVLLGQGAWLSSGMRCKGEDLPGVIGGIYFLEKVVRNEEFTLGENVAIIGGGNTAMDACRTAVRLGAKNVYNVYRRTKAEMPADQEEIIEGEEEGVIFKNLTNPLEFIAGEDGRVSKMLLQVMELGEPDASGRRAPKPIEGKTELIDVDRVILAIGQAVDPSGFAGVDRTKRNAIAYDRDTFMTSIPGVFAGGDCGNDKISIAIEAIADAKKLVGVMDKYLQGEAVSYKKPYFVERDDITERTFEDRERMCRPKMAHLHAEERKDNFTEVVFGYKAEQAMADASRCLECGCHDYFECKLVDIANQYDVKPGRFKGEINTAEFKDDHPFILRDPNKCILCGLCVRVCDEVMGVGALGLVRRGFDTVVKPALEKPLAESGCISCGQCVHVCPTGALQEIMSLKKPVPLSTEVSKTTCGYCSIGCSLLVENHGPILIKANPDKEGIVNEGISCGKGKWGFDVGTLEGKLEGALARKNGELAPVPYYDATMLAAKKAQVVATKYGKDAVAVAISDRYTNEEAYAIQKLAKAMGAKTLCFNHRASGLAPVLGLDASPNTIQELQSTGLILVAGFVSGLNPVLMVKLRQAAKNGAQVVVLNPVGCEGKWDFAQKLVYTDNDLNALKQVAKVVADSGKGAKCNGFEAFAASLSGVEVSEEIKAIADMYLGAKKAMIVYQQNLVSTEAATLLADIALMSGHIGSPRDGILQVKAKNNSQGLIDLGITAGVEALEGVKALLVFGEDPAMDLSGFEFVMVSDMYLTETAKKADVVIAGTGFASAHGSFTNTERRFMPVQGAVSESGTPNWKIVADIARAYDTSLGFTSEEDMVAELKVAVPAYRYAKEAEVLGGALKPVEPQLIAVADAAFVEPMKSTDALLNIMMERIPKPAR